MSDEYKKMVGIGQEMIQQNNRSTQYPLFIIQSEKFIHGPEGDTKWIADLTAGVFFTEQAAQRHLIVNSHHYGSPTRIYVVSAWRNPEMQLVMKQIIKTAGKVPSHYE